MQPLKTLELYVGFPYLKGLNSACKLWFSGVQTLKHLVISSKSVLEIHHVAIYQVLTYRPWPKKNILRETYAGYFRGLFPVILLCPVACADQSGKLMFVSSRSK